MKRLQIFAFAAGLLLMPLLAYAEYGQASNSPPPVAPTLVREGDFAVKLVETLKIGKASDEAQAEKMLVDVGISPKNGWISDYPVTPDVIGDVRDAVVKAAGSGKLAMKKTDALKGLEDVEASLGIQVDVAKGGGGSEAKVTSSEYADGYNYTSPEVVNNYYYDEGPPVMTYYSPPWDYYYLYDWVPYPFWWTDFYFPGYYVLRTFTVNVVVVDGRCFVANGTNAVVSGGISRVVSNVVVDPVTRRTEVLDPVNKQLVSASTREREFRGGTASVGSTGTASRGWTGDTHKSAESIFSRSTGRDRTGRDRTGFGREGAGISGNTARIETLGRGRGESRGSVTVDRGGSAGRGEMSNVPAIQRQAPSRRSEFSAPSAVGEGRRNDNFSQPSPSFRSESPRSFESSRAPEVNRGGGSVERSYSAPAPAMRSESPRSFSAPAAAPRGGSEGGGGKGFGGRGDGEGFGGGHFGGGGCVGRHC